MTLDSNAGLQTIKLVIEDLAGSFRYFPQGILTGMVMLIVLLAWNYTQKKKGKSQISMVYGICMAIYGVVLLYLTLFSREAGSRDKIDLVLFGTIGKNPRTYSYVVENILLFIPFGVLLPKLFRKFANPMLCLLMGSLVSFMIETTQLLTKRGYFQLDDIVTNAVGTFIGWLIFHIVHIIQTKYIK